MFHADALPRELERFSIGMNADADVVLPEFSQMQIVISFEVVNLDTVSHQQSNRIDDCRESPDEVRVTPDPEIEDVADEKKVSWRLLPARFRRFVQTCEEPQKSLRARIIARSEVEIGNEIGARSHQPELPRAMDVGQPRRART